MNFKKKVNYKYKMSSFYQKMEKEFSELLRRVVTDLIVDISKEFRLDEDQLKNFVTGKLSKPSQKKIDDFFQVDKVEEKVEKKVIEKVEKKKVEKKKEDEKEIDKEALANDKDLDIRKLMNCNLTELKALCKRHGLKQAGKKEELIKRLQGKEGEEEVEKKDEKKKKSPTKKEKENNDSKVLKKIENNAPTIGVRRNEFGNLMHLESGLVMEKETKVFYGKQLPDGSVIDLTVDDIEVCKMYNLNYSMPENLDKNKKGLDDVKIDEMESDDEKVDRTDKVMKALINDEEEKKVDQEETEYEEVEYEEEYEYEEVEEEVEN